MQMNHPKAHRKLAASFDVYVLVCVCVCVGWLVGVFMYVYRVSLNWYTCICTFVSKCVRVCVCVCVCVLLCVGGLVGVYMYTVFLLIGIHCTHVFAHLCLYVRVCVCV